MLNKERQQYYRVTLTVHCCEHAHTRTHDIDTATLAGEDRHGMPTYGRGFERLMTDEPPGGGVANLRRQLRVGSPAASAENTLSRKQLQ